MVDISIYIVDGVINQLVLVGGLEHGFYFSIYWQESSSQLTNSFFSEG